MELLAGMRSVPTSRAHRGGRAARAQRLLQLQKELIRTEGVGGSSGSEGGSTRGWLRGPPGWRGLPAEGPPLIPPLPRGGGHTEGGLGTPPHPLARLKQWQLLCAPGHAQPAPSCSACGPEDLLATSSPMGGSGQGCLHPLPSCSPIGETEAQDHQATRSQLEFLLEGGVEEQSGWGLFAGHWDSVSLAGAKRTGPL